MELFHHQEQERFLGIYAQFPLQPIDGKTKKQKKQKRSN